MLENHQCYGDYKPHASQQQITFPTFFTFLALQWYSDLEYGCVAVDESIVV